MTKIAKYNPAQDLWLVQRVRLGGSRAAFGGLVEKYQSPLRRYLTQLTGGNRSRADDLAQETFIKAFTSIRQFNGLGSFRAWLFRIAYRQFLDSCRSRKPQYDLEQVPYWDLPQQAEGVEMGILQTALGCLDETERNVILLSAVEQLSHSQIAEVADLPLGTVKTVVARAKTKLRTYLKNEEL